MTVVQFLVVLFVYPETKGRRWRLCSAGWCREISFGRV